MALLKTTYYKYLKSFLNEYVFLTKRIIKNNYYTNNLCSKNYVKQSIEKKENKLLCATCTCMGS